MVANVCMVVNDRLSPSQILPVDILRNKPLPADNNHRDVIIVNKLMDISEGYPSKSGELSEGKLSHCVLAHEAVGTRRRF